MNTFPLVPIPPKLYARIGRPDPGTTIYRKQGPQEDSAAWFSFLTKTVGQTVSPGGVMMFCPVSRAAVHKRAKEGRLSIFLYHPTYAKKGLFGKIKTIRQSPYGYVPVSEALAWREELEERAIQRREITREELVGTNPDWDGNFLEWPKKNERPGLYDTLREDGNKGLLDMVINEFILKLSPEKQAAIRKAQERVREGEMEKRDAAGNELMKEKARKRRSTK